MDFINEEINRYAELHTSDESDLLKKINRDTHANVLMPRMLSGHLQGRVLSMLSHMIKPSLIVEIGTYTGYSALCLAEGLTESGKIITIDINEELKDKVDEFFNQSAFSGKIDYRIGDALELVPEIDGPVDMAFIDADKINYSNYFDQLIEKLRTGGIIVADNVLWSGQVLEGGGKKPTKDTLALIEFNEKVQSDSRVENVLMPVRDGLMVIRKK